MPDLFLHIGTNKTATSAIQSYCAINRDFLRTNGIIYPLVGRGENIAHHPIGALVDGRLGNAYLPKESFDVLLDSLRREITGAKSVIISSEILWCTQVDRANELEKLLRLFNSATIIVYFRRQDSYAVSAYNSKIKINNFNFNLFKETPSFEEYCQKANMNWLKCIQRWQILANDAKLVVRPYAKIAWRDRDIISDYFGIIDRHLRLKSVSDKRIVKNKSLPIHCLDLLRELNRFDIKYRDALIAIIKDLVPHDDHSGEGLLSKDIQARLLEKYAESNQKLSQYWSPEDNQAFSDTRVPTFDKPFSGLSERDYAKLIADIWSSKPMVQG